ncbi:hypothetical protein SAMN05216593_104165 [Pseudomonas asturiensis]|uniref:Uncharacterized protein n=1 Tax=Pseudomonas asturiensis TaxID=1190415 RepID=A0A1M7MEL2_9PSED|nr:hypothetical protein SAMN05216593_104165 [Pseudomonas asturiensis]
MCSGVCSAPHAFCHRHACTGSAPMKRQTRGNLRIYRIAHRHSDQFFDCQCHACSSGIVPVPHRDLGEIDVSSGSSAGMVFLIKHLIAPAHRRSNRWPLMAPHWPLPRTASEMRSAVNHFPNRRSCTHPLFVSTMARVSLMGSFSLSTAAFKASDDATTLGSRAQPGRSLI